MYNYYFKIKKNNIEFEFSTDNLEDFDLKVLNWVNNICNTKKNNEGNLQHQNFIDLKSNFSLTSQTKTHNILNIQKILLIILFLLLTILNIFLIHLTLVSK